MNEEVKRIIIRALNLGGIDESNLQFAVYRTPGWDSLATLDIVEMIEEKFSIEISDVEMERCISLEAIHDLIVEKTSDPKAAIPK